MSNEIKVRIESTSPVADPVHLKTVKYDNLTGKPKINGVELVGDKSTADLKIDVDTSKFATKDELNNKADKTEIPDVSGKADKATTLSGYGITDAYTKTETDAKIGAVYHVKGSVATYDDLPENPTVGDVYNMLDTGANYVWTGTDWDKLSETVDLSGYVKNTDYATSAKAGVVKANPYFGLFMSGDSPYPATRTLEQYNSASTLFVGKGTLENIKDDYVKRGITANTIALTDEEKTSARTWLGAVGNTDYATASTYGVVKVDPDGTYGVGMNDAAGLFLVGASTPQVAAKTNGNRAITPRNLDLAVKVGVTTNTIELTDEEKAAAQAWLGVESGGGGAVLPDQAGNANRFLVTNGETTSWSLGVIEYKTGNDFKPASLFISDSSNSGSIANVNGSLRIGGNDIAQPGNKHYNTIIGIKAYAHDNAVAIGYKAAATGDYSIQLGTGTNSDANTFKVANANGNFEMMDADGNVPLERLTYVTDQIGDISTALTAILGE